MKEWKSPGLTVLVRSNPEEAVLTACKYQDTLGSHGSWYNGCNAGNVEMCAFCSQQVASWPNRQVKSHPIFSNERVAFDSTGLVCAVLMVNWLLPYSRSPAYGLMRRCNPSIFTFFHPVEETSEYIASGNNYRLIEMDTTKENGISDSRAVYTPPVVVRISDLKQGAGVCATGSGDAAECNPTGNAASGSGCVGTGNSALSSPYANGCRMGPGAIGPNQPKPE